MGVDVFIYSTEQAGEVIRKASSVTSLNLALQLISNRGVKIWPNGHPETSCIEQWRLRFLHKNQDEKISQTQIIELLESLTHDPFDIIKTENLYLIDGQPGYSSC